MGPSHGVVGAGVIRVYLEGLEASVDRTLVVPAAQSHLGQIVVSGGKIGPKAYHLLIDGGRFFEPAARLEQVAQAVQKNRFQRIQGDCPADQALGVIEVTFPGVDIPEAVQGVGMIGLQLQHFHQP